MKVLLKQTAVLGLLFALRSVHSFEKNKGKVRSSGVHADADEQWERWLIEEHASMPPYAPANKFPPISSNPSIMPSPFSNFPTISTSSPSVTPSSYTEATTAPVISRMNAPTEAPTSQVRATFTIAIPWPKPIWTKNVTNSDTEMEESSIRDSNNTTPMPVELSRFDASNSTASLTAAPTGAPIRRDEPRGRFTGIYDRATRIP